MLPFNTLAVPHGLPEAPLAPRLVAMVTTGTALGSMPSGRGGTHWGEP